MGCIGDNTFRSNAVVVCLSLVFAYGGAGEARSADGFSGDGGAVDAACAERQGADALRIVSVTRTPESDIRQYEKLELEVSIAGTMASAPYWPLDLNAPSGVTGAEGITVDAVFEAPNGTEHNQPAFYYQEFVEEVRQGKDWQYPTDRFSWRVRFSPDTPGVWHFRVQAVDRCGAARTERLPFYVTPSDHKGFVRVSAADKRYFEFEDGTPFYPLGFELPPHLENPNSAAAPLFENLQDSGVTLVRIWISSIYGSAWHPLVGGRNQYRGYLPVVGLLPVQGSDHGPKELAMRIDYEPEGDTGWFDACRMEWLHPIAVKPNTSYRISVEYLLEEIAGPRRRESPNYGVVAKLGGWHGDCYEPGTSKVVTTHGRSAGDWSAASGIWHSGENSFLPNLHVALENVAKGSGYLRAVSIREVFEDGTLGPEIRPKPSMQLERYLSQAQAAAFDRIVQLAEEAGVYLKVVISDKNDEMWLKIADDGAFVSEDDNLSGFYGVGRSVNKTRWLQMAWWRYVQARWGYSTAIHSWELLNEGDPSLVRHYEMADEFGKYMHQGVFGLAERSELPLVARRHGPRSPRPHAANGHANSHLVTTSFWHSFPATEFWANPEYPDIDYADLHAYVSTSFAPSEEKEKMAGDAAYFHLWHSRQTSSLSSVKPVIRGEAGLDSPHLQTEKAAALERDTDHLWLHNYVWSTLDSGALGEIYWWDSHIWKGRREQLAPFARLMSFLSDIPLNAGGYEDWNGSSSNPLVRVVGQKNVETGRAHLWIQNLQHTWKNAVDGVQASPASATIIIPGFRPGAVVIAERWDTRSGLLSSSEESAVQSDGSVALRTELLTTDVALKLQVKR